jgi:membrane protease subunit HflC
MKKAVTVLVVVGAIIIILLIVGPFYVVMEGEQALRIRFGQIIDAQTEAGLKIKTPFVDQVTKYPKKIVSWDGAAQIIPTKQPENQFIWVDTTARWRIVDSRLFFESVGTVNQMQSRLDDVIDSNVRSVISQNFLIDAIRNTNEIYDTIKGQLEEQRAILRDAGQEGEAELSADESVINVASYRLTPGTGREALSQDMYRRASEAMLDDGKNQFGIELIDVVVRQIKYSDDLTESVYQRMIQERNQAAQRTRSEGRGEKDRILGRLDRDVQEIITEAERQAEEIKGAADAEATRVYAVSYSSSPEFFRLWRSLESYKKLLPTFDKTMTTDAQYFDYLYQYAR